MGRAKSGKIRRADQTPSMSGVFDWLRRRMAEFERLRPPGGPPPSQTLPALPAPAQLPALPAPPRASSRFEIMRPREEPRAIVPFTSPAAQMFLRFAPTEPPAPPPPEEQQTLWRALFPAVEEEPSAMEMFAALAPGGPAEAPLVEREIRFPSGERVPIWAIATDWRMPTRWEMVQRIRENWPDLPDLWDYVRGETDYPSWRSEALRAAAGGEPPAFEIDVIAQPGDPDDRLSLYLGVPRQVWNAYYGRIRNEYEAFEAGNLYFEEVLSPLLQRFTAAMDILKPPGLRGWFEISPVASSPGGPPYWWFRYRDAGRW